MSDQQERMNRLAAAAIEAAEAHPEATGSERFIIAISYENDEERAGALVMSGWEDLDVDGLRHELQHVMATIGQAAGVHIVAVLPGGNPLLN